MTTLAAPSRPPHDELRRPEAYLACAKLLVLRLVEAIVAQHGGTVVRPRGEGDSRFAVFPRTTDDAAAALQQALHGEPWSLETPLRVRIALHTGEADVRDGDYYGAAVNRAARVRTAAHGGEVGV